MGFCWGNLKEENHLEYLSIDERIILKFTNEIVQEVWTEFIADNRNK
jgi:hypothetical protein